MNVTKIMRIRVSLTFLYKKGNLIQNSKTYTKFKAANFVNYSLGPWYSFVYKKFAKVPQKRHFSTFFVAFWQCALFTTQFLCTEPVTNAVTQFKVVFKTLKIFRK